VGRTGRAGKFGKAHLILTEVESKFMELLVERHRISVADETVRVGREEVVLSGALSEGGLSELSQSGLSESLTSDLTSGPEPQILGPGLSEALQTATQSWAASTSMNYLAASAYASLLMHFRCYHNALNLDNAKIVYTVEHVLRGAGLLQVPVISRDLAYNLGMEGEPGLKVARGLLDDENVGQDVVEGAASKGSSSGATGLAMGSSSAQQAAHYEDVGSSALREEATERMHERAAWDDVQRRRGLKNGGANSPPAIREFDLTGGTHESVSSAQRETPAQWRAEEDALQTHRYNEEARRRKRAALQGRIAALMGGPS